jgi:hypothetical protein
VEWVEVFVVFVISHLVGDFVLQTDWQAVNKHGGLARGNTVGRSALLSHVATYTLAFLPCFVWMFDALSWGVLAVAAGIAIPHVLQDDGRLLATYMRRVKGGDPKTLPVVALGLDQTLHAVTLMALAIVTAAR